MVTLILFFVVVGASAGIPLLPVILVGALCQALLAYLFTRNPLSLSFGMGALIAVIVQFVLLPAIQSGYAGAVAFLPAFTLLSYVLATLSLAGASAIGFLGVRNRARTD